MKIKYKDEKEKRKIYINEKNQKDKNKNNPENKNNHQSNNFSNFQYFLESSLKISEIEKKL